jgi:hypothetical protein
VAADGVLPIDDGWQRLWAQKDVLTEQVPVKKDRRRLYWEVRPGPSVGVLGFGTFEAIEDLETRMAVIMLSGIARQNVAKVGEINPVDRCRQPPHELPGRNSELRPRPEVKRDPWEKLTNEDEAVRFRNDTDDARDTKRDGDPREALEHHDLSTGSGIKARDRVLTGKKYHGDARQVLWVRGDLYLGGEEIA